MVDQQPDNALKDLPRASWQILFSEIIQDGTVLEALAKEIGFAKISLARWGRGVVPNNVQTLRRLVDCRSFPKHYRDRFIEEIRKSYPDFYSESVLLMEEGPVKQIPSIFYSHVLRSYAFVPDNLVFS